MCVADFIGRQWIRSGGNTAYAAIQQRAHTRQQGLLRNLLQGAPFLHGEPFAEATSTNKVFCEPGLGYVPALVATPVEWLPIAPACIFFHKCLHSIRIPPNLGQSLTLNPLFSSRYAALTKLPLTPLSTSSLFFRCDCVGLWPAYPVNGVGLVGLTRFRCSCSKDRSGPSLHSTKTTCEQILYFKRTKGGGTRGRGPLRWLRLRSPCVRR